MREQINKLQIEQVALRSDVERARELAVENKASLNAFHERLDILNEKVATKEDVIEIIENGFNKYAASAFKKVVIGILTIGGTLGLAWFNNLFSIGK